MAALTQKAAFTDDFSTLADKPNKTAAEMKALFNSRSGELLTYINNTQIPELTGGSYDYATTSVGTDAYAVTITGFPAAYAAGQEVFILADVANTGAATAKVNSLAAVAIRKNGTTVLEDGDIVLGGIAHLKHDGTYWQLLNPQKTGALTTHLADTTTMHGAIATATASKLALRNAEGQLYAKNRATAADGCWSTEESKTVSSLASGGTLASTAVISTIAQYLVMVIIQTGTNAGDCGFYSVGRFGSTAVIDTLSAITDVAISLDGSYHVVLTNNTGGVIGYVAMNILEVV